MSIVTADEGDSNIYSSGVWFQQNYGSQAYGGTISWADDAGDSKVVRFIGTSISVGGALQPVKGGNRPLVMQFIIDGGTPYNYSPASPSDFQYVTYYQSPQLPLGEHVLTVVNMVSGDIVLLDSFTVRANGGTAQILKSDGSPTPRRADPPPPPPPSTTPSNNNPPPSPTSQTPVSPVTITVQQPAPSNTTTGSPNDTTDQPSPSQSQSQSQSLQSNTNVNNGNTRSSTNTSSRQGSSGNSNASSANSATSTFSAGIYNPTTINANDPNGQANKESSKTPIIIAVVTSVLLVVSILGIILFLLRRRQKKRHRLHPSETQQVSPYAPPSPASTAAPLVNNSEGPYQVPHDVQSQLDYSSGTMGATGASIISSLKSTGNRSNAGQEKRNSFNLANDVSRPMNRLSEAGLPPYIA